MRDHSHQVSDSVIASYIQDLSAEIQKLKDENRRLKMLQKLQAEFKKLKRENQKLRKQTNTQPNQASE